MRITTRITDIETGRAMVTETKGGEAGATTIMIAATTMDGATAVDITDTTTTIEFQ